MADVKVFAKDLEQTAAEQVSQLAALPPFSDSKIRIMADAHAGKGCVIGFTADLGDKIIPSVVGVDIGCGVLAVQVERTPDREFLERLDSVVVENVPAGFAVHKGRRAKQDFQAFHCNRELRDPKRIERSLGTLGGGNHFIELDVGADPERPWLVIHTGSRNLGKQVAEIYQHKAVMAHKGEGRYHEERERLIREYKEQGRRKEIQAALKAMDAAYAQVRPDVPEDLCWLEGQLAQDYLHDMRLCQEFARANRAEIAGIILEALDLAECGRIESVHNYIDDDGMTRKGAISAAKDEDVVIPLNMAAGTVIGRGLGNEDYNCSAPHGAGRRLSRKAANEQLSMDEYRQQMDGIYTTSVDESTLDEAPDAYKPSQEILESLRPTVEVREVLRPVYNFKASKLRERER